MKIIEFGKERPRGSSGMYLKVKTPGDTIKFRIANNPAYVGKHFIQTETGWEVKTCSRINEGEKCELCEKFFSIKEDEKKAKEAGDTGAQKLLSKEARKYSPSVIYYFPILLRDTNMSDWEDKKQKFVILQTTEGVRNKINEFYNAEVKIFQRDLILKRTNSDVPKEYYAISVVDSSETKELTPNEKEELQKAHDFDMTSINDGSSNVDEVGDVDTEDIDKDIVEVAKEIFEDDK